MNLPAQLTVLCLTLWVSTTALYEDQIGKFDWHQQYVGHIKYLQLNARKSATRRFFVGSVRNILAAINIRDGTILWRQSMEEGGTLLGIENCDSYLISLSESTGATLRAWDSTTGAIVWEYAVSKDSTNKGFLKCDPDKNMIIMAYGKSVRGFNLRTGQIVWSSKDGWLSSAPNDYLVVEIPSTPSKSIFTVLNFHHSGMHHSRSDQNSTSAFGLTTFTYVRGQQEVVTSSNGVYPLDWLARGFGDCMVLQSSGSSGHPTLVCASADSTGLVGQLHTLMLSPEFTGWRTISTPIVSGCILNLLESNVLVYEPSTGVGIVYGVDENDNLILAYQLDKITVASAATIGTRKLLFTLHHERDQPFRNLALNIYDLETGQLAADLPSRQFTLASHNGDLEAMSVILFADNTGTIGFRLLLRTKDHAIQLLRHSGRQQWIREEALADIIAVEMVDLPVSESEARMEDEFGHANSNVAAMFIKRITTQIAQLVTALKRWASVLSRLMLRTFVSTSTQPTDSSDERDIASEANDPATDVPVIAGTPPRLHFAISNEDLNADESAMSGSVPHLSSEFKKDTATSASSSSSTLLDEFLTRDDFNLHKMIVAVTSVGKIFGLESEGGRVVWEYLVPNATLLADGKLALFQQRTTAHFPLPPLSTLLLKSKLDGRPMFYSFNPVTGVPANVEGDPVHHVDVDLLQAVLMPGPIGELTKYIRPILLLDAKSQVHIYPPTLNSSLTQLDKLPTYIYTVESQTAVVTGYRIQHTVSDHSTELNEEQMSNLTDNLILSGSSSNQRSYHAIPMWKMQLSSSQGSQSIVAETGRPLAEHIHSVGRVLGDRSVLYKYLNPNLIAILTAGGDVAAQRNNLTLYLVDTVTGRIVYSLIHRRCGSPLGLILSENWVVYHYYNHKSLRNEVTVLELFEPTTGGDQLIGELCVPAAVPGPWQLFLHNIFPSFSSIFSSSAVAVTGTDEGEKQSDSVGSVFSSLRRTTASQSVCHSSPLIPHVIQRAFILPSPPRAGALAVSLTERGITAKSIVLALEKGGIIELPKAMLDPRRTLEMTADLMEEGVQPYAPVLPLSDQAVMTYNQTIHGIQHIRTAATGLESTSLVFAYGLDIFFTRIAPSMTYDLLKEDFDYTAIATVTIGMIVASVVTHRLAARRAVYRAWQ